MHRSYSNQVKAECIEMYVGLGIPVPEIARKMNIPKSTVNEWINRLWFGRVQKRYGHYIDLSLEVRRWKD